MLSLLKKMKYRKGVFIVVYLKQDNKIKYLLLKRKLHWKGWEFPKGGIESKESIKKTIIREVKEETGQIPMKITNHKVEGKYKYDKELKDRNGIEGQTYKLYSAEITKEKIKIDKKEHSKFKWVDFKTAIKMLSWSNQRRCLKKVDNQNLLRS